jgi:hypothetical protein
MDRVEWSVDSPQEDEFALCILSQKSPCMGWIFPRSLDLYDKYLTLRDVDERELDAWRSAFESFLRKLTWKHRRRLVLKSPPHTARIRLVLEMFPGAKFVHIHRDPYRVFQSSQKTFELNFEWQGLQRTRRRELDDWILRQYRTMYDSFFEDRERIPKGHYCGRFESRGEPIVGCGASTTLAFTILRRRSRRAQASLAGYQRTVQERRAACGSYLPGNGVAASRSGLSGSSEAASGLRARPRRAIGSEQHGQHGPHDEEQDPALHVGQHEPQPAKSGTTLLPLSVDEVAHPRRPENPEEGWVVSMGSFLGRHRARAPCPSASRDRYSNAGRAPSPASPPRRGARHAKQRHRPRARRSRRGARPGDVRRRAARRLARARPTFHRERRHVPGRPRRSRPPARGRWK